MDPKLLHYYNRELRHVREMGGEFASEFPKIAGRLGLDSFECADPYVERLLEGFAFLAARVQLKVDAQFPVFTQHLLELVYPHYLAPIPSMAVVQFQPDLTEGSLMEGFTIPRQTALRSQIPKGEQTACEYRTAHDITLWPVSVVEAEYLASTSAVANLGVPCPPGLKAGLRLRLRTTAAGATFDQIALDSLPIFLRGTDALPAQIYEQLLANALALAVLPTSRNGACEYLPKAPIRRLGFGEHEALLPYGPQSFGGYRLLQEYFAFPERYLFVELSQLNPLLRRFNETEVDVIVLLNRSHPLLANALEPSQFTLFCTPAINLFPRRGDRIHLDRTASEYHILADRSRPMDYEVHHVAEVVAYGDKQGEEKAFLPLYGSRSGYLSHDERAYYTLRREKRMPSSKQRRVGPRSSYIGSETFIALADRREAPFGSELKQLGLQLYCTNRDLPMHMPLGAGNTDFSCQEGGPVQSIRCVAGPTKPRPSIADGEMAWRLLNHLSLNYLTLLDTDAAHGAAALRELLSLYGNAESDALRKQIDGLLSVTSKNVVRRIDAAGPIVFGRGLEIAVNFDESAFVGSGAFLLGGVLDQFFARYASINSFTETVVSTIDRGEIMRWPIRIGQRHTV